MSEDDPRKDTGDAPEESSSALEQQDGETTDYVGERNLPLTAHEFRDVLQQIDALGLTWTADLVPGLRPKGREGYEALLGREYKEIQRQYPHLPRELGLVVFHALTGRSVSSRLTDTEEDLAAKVAVVREILLTGDYRAEFFFKHAIKVPYFANVDWEVVIKAFEKNVKDMPAIPYALLSLHFYGANEFHQEEEERQTMTVAVDERLVDRLIKSLTEVKAALKRTRGFTDAVSEGRIAEEEDND